MTRANGFLDSAGRLAKDPDPYAPSVGLLSWQASELGLKALAEGHGIPFKHDLKSVMEHLKDNGVLDPKTLAQLEKYVVTTTSSGSYNNLRYPYENARFWETMPVAETRVRFDAAVKIVQICREKLQG